MARYLKNGISHCCPALFSFFLVHFLFVTTHWALASAEPSLVVPSLDMNHGIGRQSEMNTPIVLSAIPSTIDDGVRNFEHRLPATNLSNSFSFLNTGPSHKLLQERSDQFNQNSDFRTGLPKPQYMRSNSQPDSGSSHSKVAGLLTIAEDLITSSFVITEATIFPLTDPTRSPEQNSDGQPR